MWSILAALQAVSAIWESELPCGELTVHYARRVNARARAQSKSERIWYGFPVKRGEKKKGCSGIDRILLRQTRALRRRWRSFKDVSEEEESNN